MTYSGNLVRTAQQPDARTLPFPSATHGDAGTPDPYPASHQVDAGTGQEYDGTAMPVDQVIGGGMTLDTPTPWEGGPNPHDSDAVLSWVKNDDQHRDTIVHAHEGTSDRGWVRTTYEAPPMQASTEVRGEMVFDGFTTPFQATGQADMNKYVKGINSRPENNPNREGYVNGYRPGIDRHLAPNIDRYHGRTDRVYEVQPLTQRDFYYPTNQPNTEWAPDSHSIFPSMTQVVRQYLQAPAMSSDPGNFDDSLMAAQQVDPNSGVIDGSVI